MKFSTIFLGVALYLLSPASAGISTNTPFNSVTWEGGDDEDVVWVDDNKAPKLAEIGVTSVDLMMGNSTNQVFVANIGKVPATAKKITYKVPEDVGPPGNNYFIKYTAGAYTAFSGTFSIEDVNGKIASPPATPPVAALPTDPAAPPKAPKATDPKTADPNTVLAEPKAVVPDSDPNAVPVGTPKSTSSSSAANPTASTAQNNLPTPISNDSPNLFPSFSGVAAAAVAFAFTYLY